MVIISDERKAALKRFLDTWSYDYAFKTYLTSGFSVLFGFVFMVYNGIMGVVYSSVWNGSVCVYYLLLAVTRGIIVNSQRDEAARPNDSRRKRRVVLVTHLLILLMDLSLVAPIAAMVKGVRTYNWGLVPAIAIAGYTTFRIVMAIRNLRKARRQDDILIQELRTIYLMDTLFAILILQNTMIIANNGEVHGSMKVLSIITSSIIVLVIYVISIISFILSRRGKKSDDLINNL